MIRNWDTNFTIQSNDCCFGRARCCRHFCGVRFACCTLDAITSSSKECSTSCGVSMLAARLRWEKFLCDIQVTFETLGSSISQRVRLEAHCPVTPVLQIAGSFYYASDSDQAVSDIRLDFSAAKQFYEDEADLILKSLPSFKKGNICNPPALLQIAKFTTAYLFRLKWEGMDTSDSSVSGCLLSLLSDPLDLEFTKMLQLWIFSMALAAVAIALPTLI